MIYRVTAELDFEVNDEDEALEAAQESIDSMCSETLVAVHISNEVVVQNAS